MKFTKISSDSYFDLFKVLEIQFLVGPFLSSHCYPLSSLQVIDCQLLSGFRRTNKAAHDQIEKLWHTTNIYMHSPIHEYAKKLTDKLPGDLKVRIHTRPRGKCCALLYGINAAKR